MGLHRSGACGRQVEEFSFFAAQVIHLPDVQCPPSRGQQSIVNGGELGWGTSPHKLDGFFHRTPRTVDRDSQQVDAGFGRVQRVPGMVDAPVICGDAEPHVADARNVGMNNSMGAAGDGDLKRSTCETLSGRQRRGRKRCRRALRKIRLAPHPHSRVGGMERRERFGRKMVGVGVRYKHGVNIGEVVPFGRKRARVDQQPVVVGFQEQGRVAKVGYVHDGSVPYNRVLCHHLLVCVALVGGVTSATITTAAASETSAARPVTAGPVAVSAADVPGSNDDMAWTRYAQLGDRRITESSGLAWRDGHLLTVNDSGGKAVVYVVDPKTGEVSATWRFSDRKPRDVEALAATSDGVVWVGDIGDNSMRRRTITLYRFDAPNVTQDATVTATRWELTYPDGAEDAEALMIHPETGRILIATKGLLGGTLYATADGFTDAVTPPDTPTELTELGMIPAMITDGVFSPAGTVLLLRSYSNLYTYSYPDLKRLARRALPAQRQGETMTTTPDGDVLIGSEGRDSDVLLLNPVEEWAHATTDAPATQTATPDHLPPGEHPPGPDPTAIEPAPDTPEAPLTPAEKFQRSLSRIVPDPIEPYLRYWPVLPVALVMVVLGVGWATRPRP